MTRIIAVIALIILVLSTLVGCGTAAPQAKFSATPTIGYALLEVQFSDKSTGNISSWEWDFNNDGVVDSTIQNPEYAYENPGNYTVSLTVRGPNGNNTAVKADYIEVTRCPYLADFIVEPTPGNCKVQGEGLSCTGTITVQFIDKSTGNVTGWAWDFQSDGKIDSTQQNPTYRYTRNGVYSITLTVTTSTCEDTITKHDYISISGCST